MPVCWNKPVSHHFILPVCLDNCLSVSVAALPTDTHTHTHTHTHTREGVVSNRTFSRVKDTRSSHIPLPTVRSLRFGHRFPSSSRRAIPIFPELTPSSLRSVRRAPNDGRRHRDWTGNAFTPHRPQRHTTSTILQRLDRLFSFHFNILTAAFVSKYFHLMESASDFFQIV